MNLPFFFIVAFIGLLTAGQSLALDSDGNDEDSFFQDFVPRYKRDNEDQYMKTLAGIHCGRII